MRLTTQEKETGKLSPERLAESTRTFLDAGLLVIEDVYEADFLSQVREAYEAALAIRLDSLGGLDALDGKTFGKNHIGYFPPMTGILGDVRLAAHPIATQLLISLLGENVQCSFYHTNTAMPRSGIQPVHRDSGSLFGTEMSVPHPPHAIVLNIPLCDFTEENGSTEYWPGTHLIVDRTIEEGKHLEERIDACPSIRLNMKLGSFALRDLRAWHRGMPNNADYPRTMFANVYQRGWLAEPPMPIPRSTWESWPEEAKHIFRKNKIQEDAEYRPLQWGERN